LRHRLPLAFRPAHKFRNVASVFLVLLATGCSSTAVARNAHALNPPIAATARSYELASSPTSILVVGDRIDGYERYSQELPLSIAVLLSHFTADTRWLFTDQVTQRDVTGASAVVYVGDNETVSVPRGTLRTLGSAKRLVLFANHLKEFRESGAAFAHLAPLGRHPVPSGAQVTYEGKRLSFSGDSYIDLPAVDAAAVVSSIVWRGGHVPYIVRDGSATFVNGPIDFGENGLDPERNAYKIVLADALTAALGARRPASQHLAMLRLEDVSVQTPVEKLRDIVMLLNDLKVPYGIGVIPDQWVAGKQLQPLRRDRGLVTILRWAQAHGATIVLHGLHHSFHSAEDFEFWDAARDRPLSYDSSAWMKGRIKEGLHDELAVGLKPMMWETPHYTASSVDYAQTARFFTTAWEQRRPLGWFPWVLQRDQYGQRLLPEDLGYVALGGDPQESLDAQMKRARVLLICRACLATGFLHPSTVSPNVVSRYVENLRAMGYVFADPRRFIANRQKRSEGRLAAERSR